MRSEIIMRVESGCYSQPITTLIISIITQEILMISLLCCCVK